MKGDPCIGGKRSKERVTVLLAANVTGTERLPLLVIGKAQKPRCFKNINNLPVDYRANRKAWMTGETFADTADSMRAAEHLEGLRKIVSARISARKQTSIRDYFVK